MKKPKIEDMAKMFKISVARAMEGRMKAEMISAVARAVEKDGLTHAELAKRSGLPRSAVTGILSGSLQKITLDRVLKLVDGAGLIAEVRIHRKSA